MKSTLPATPRMSEVKTDQSLTFLSTLHTPLGMEWVSLTKFTGTFRIWTLTTSPVSTLPRTPDTTVGSGQTEMPAAALEHKTLFQMPFASPSTWNASYFSPPPPVLLFPSLTNSIFQVTIVDSQVSRYCQASYVASYHTAFIPRAGINDDCLCACPRNSYKLQEDRHGVLFTTVFSVLDRVLAKVRNNDSN